MDTRLVQVKGQLGFLKENVTATATTNAKAPALRCPIFNAEKAATVQTLQAEEQ